MSTAGAGDKRSVTTDALETLGTCPIDKDQKRDAIHLAVEPVIAGNVLSPGDDVVVHDGIAYNHVNGVALGKGEGLGIIDPFIKRVTIERGERVWFVMYPRQVHSLRHVWTHPAFPDV